jgi:hypothetical protein
VNIQAYLQIKDEFASTNRRSVKIIETEMFSFVTEVAIKAKEQINKVRFNKVM